MFEHLDDPLAPEPDDHARSAVAARAHRLVVRRRLVQASSLAAALSLIIAVPLVAAGSGGGHKTVRALSGPSTSSTGEPSGTGVEAGTATTGPAAAATGPGATTSTVRATTPHTMRPVPIATTTTVPRVPIRLADAILFFGDPYSQPGIYVMNFDGSGMTQLTHGSEDSYPAWSPDHSRIAFVRVYNVNSNTGTWKGELWVMNPDGSGQSKLTSGNLDRYPAWSRDGKRIAFASDRESGGIFVMNPDGSSITKVTSDGIEPTWSPDGKKIAFTRDDNYNSEVWVVNIDGTGEVNLTNNPDWDATPAWSPDGKKIAFESGRGSPDHVTDIYVMNADGSNPVPLAPNPAFDHDPTWSPDGKKIAFDSFRQPCGDANGCYQHIWSMNADGTGLVQLTPMPRFEYGANW